MNSIGALAKMDPGALAKMGSGALAKAAEGAATSAVTDAAGSLLPGGDTAPPGADVSAPAELTTEAKAKNSNNFMCHEFQQMFKDNQKLYGEKVFESLDKYFQEEKVQTTLTAMLEKNIGQYIRSSQFKGTTVAVIKNAIHSVMLQSLRTELKNPNNFKGMCAEIQNLSRRRTGGGGTRSKRKPRKKTVKRRN
jgi:predicted lipid-binding transport protein (Tim44 family)